MGVENAWNPLLVASVSTFAMAFQVLGGIVDCNFVHIKAHEDEVLAITKTSAQQLANETSVGLLCDGDFYDLDDDDMRMYSRSFYYAAVCLGGLCVIGAWLISTCMTPTMCAWRIIPVLASLSALSNLPTFLILEAYPCEDFPEQSCSLAMDSYYLMAAVLLYVVVTALTQLLDPPTWVSQLHHWRVPKVRTMETTNHWSSDEDDEGSQDPILTPRLVPPKNSWWWWCGRRKRRKTGGQHQASRQTVSYALPTTDIEQGDSLAEEEVVSSTKESDQPSEKAAVWTSFDPQVNTFQEKDPMDFTTGVEETPTENHHATSVYSNSDVHKQSMASLSMQKPEQNVQSFQLPSTPPHYRVEQTPVSPLTHPTTDSAPASPSIERTRVQDPILRYSSRASTPGGIEDGAVEDGAVDLTEMTTPGRRIDWSREEESIFDGIINEDEAVLDKSFDRSDGGGVPFIPTVEEAKKMATHGYSVYADLLKESPSERDQTRHYNIDELVNNKSTLDSSMDESNMGSGDFGAIASEGTPIYASLLLEQEDKIKQQFRKSPEPAARIVNTNSTSDERYFLRRSKDEDYRQQEAKTTKNKQETMRAGRPGWNLAVSLRRNNSGYDKLSDDASVSDEEPEVPPMTEVSFDPNEIKEESLDKDEVIQTENKTESELLDDWNKMFDAHGPIPVKFYESDENDDEDRKDEEDLLRLISGEDFSDESPRTDEHGDEQQKVSLKSDCPPPSASPNKPPRSAKKSTLRPKRRARRSRSRASGSVSSSPSLLEVTIEEETPSDLEEFNKEEAPIQTPLSGYASDSAKHKNRKDVRSMSSMHVCRSAEHLWSENELERITAGVQEVLKRSRSRLAKHEGMMDKPHAVRSLSPNTTRVSIRRFERENRAGIHDPVVVSDEEEDDTAGKKAQELRHYRIQRLQQRNVPEMSGVARARLRREMFFGDMQTPSRGPNSRVSQQQSRTQEPAQQARAMSALVMPTKIKDKDALAHLSPTTSTNRRLQTSLSADDSKTTTPDDVGEVGSFLLGGSNLDDLDVSLAALSRPEGSEYGPDEHSV